MQRHRRFSSVCAVAVLILASGFAVAAHAGSSGRSIETVRPTLAVNRLASDGLTRLGGSGNLVFSPFSIETALAMVDQGTAGTLKPLQELLVADDPQEAAGFNHALNQALHAAVSAHGAGGPTLDSANTVWVQAGRTLESRFQSVLAGAFGASAQRTDFTDPAAAATQINRRISDQTRGLIPSLLSPSELSAATQVVLANAVYLNARWASPFDPNATKPDSFFTTPTSRVTVPFMNSGFGTSFPYADVSGYRAVGLPYAHSSLQFLAILPPAGQLSALEHWLGPGNLERLGAALRPRSIDLSMPKFTLSTSVSLNGFLASLGLGDLFNADGGPGQLTQIIAGEKLGIGAVQHAAVLKVAENGTVAAAGTGVTVAPTAVAAREPMFLSLNRPFIVLIRDTRTGAVLFAARVQDPAGS